MKKIFVLIIFMFIFSCGNDGVNIKVEDGDKDGNCFANSTCNDGLVCVDGVCVEKNEENDSDINIDVDEKHDSDSENPDNIIDDNEENDSDIIENEDNTTDETIVEDNEVIDDGDVIVEDETTVDDDIVIEDNIFKETSGSRLKLIKSKFKDTIIRRNIIDTMVVNAKKDIPCKFMKHKWEDKYRCYPYVNVFDIKNHELSFYAKLDFEILIEGEYRSCPILYISRDDIQFNDNFNIVLVIKNGNNNEKIVDSILYTFDPFIRTGADYLQLKDITDLSDSPSCQESIGTERYDNSNYSIPLETFELAEEKTLE